MDDEDAILDTGAEMLEGLGYHVITAPGGRAGVERYLRNRERISLVILDMIMPECSGKDTFDLLRSADPSVRVLLTSGYGLCAQAKEILARGCRGFIQKPFTLAELSRKVRAILDEGHV